MVIKVEFIQQNFLPFAKLMIDGWRPLAVMEVFVSGNIELEQQISSKTFRYTENLDCSNLFVFVFRLRPIKFVEKSRAGAQMLCLSFSPGRIITTNIILSLGLKNSLVNLYSL